MAGGCPDGGADEGKLRGQSRELDFGHDVGRDRENKHGADDEDEPPVDMGMSVSVLDNQDKGNRTSTASRRYIQDFTEG
jgi:hypothetical protein